MNLISGELSREDLDVIRTVLYESLGIENISNEDARSYWEEVPMLIKMEAVKWGTSDTVVRDELYMHFKSTV